MAKRKAPKTADDSASRVRSVPVEFVFPEKFDPVYANQMLVQTDGSASYLSFFLARPPVMLGDETEVRERLAQLESVKSQLVVQVIVPHERMPEFVKVLSDHAEKMTQAKSEIIKSQQAS